MAFKCSNLVNTRFPDRTRRQYISAAILSTEQWTDWTNEMHLICCSVGYKNRKGSEELTVYFTGKIIVTINRDHWSPTEHHCLCNERFSSGQAVSSAYALLHEWKLLFCQSWSWEQNLSVKKDVNLSTILNLVLSLMYVFPAKHLNRYKPIYVNYVIGQLGRLSQQLFLRTFC